MLAGFAKNIPSFDSGVGEDPMLGVENLVGGGGHDAGIGKDHAEQGGLAIDYHHRLPEDLPKERKRYDVVLNMEVIEHVANLTLFLKASANLIKPSGAILLSTLNRTVKSLALAKVGA